LYLCRLAGEVWWSSEIAFLLAVVNDSFPLDENFVAGYLTTTEEPHQTPYRGIQSVTPGTLVRVRRNQLETRTFWRPEPKRTIRYRGDGEYEEHFRELFSDSLRCRLRAKGAVMCELSGGLDSSAIVCTADRLVRGGETEATRLETVSFLYDESRTSDESAFINEVIQATGLQNHRVIDRRILSDALVHEDYFFPNPHRSYIDTFAQTEQLMRKSGARVLLSGACGDHVFMHDQGYYPILAELLTHGKFWYAHRLTKSLSRQTKNSYWRTLWLGAVWPWLPVQWRLTLSPERMRLPDWVEEDFAVRTQCHERNLLRKEVQSYSNPCLQQRLSLVWNAISASSSHRYREHQCVEISMPYLHMPLVHFLIEIPSDQLLRPGEDRSIQRRSMAGILPERIRIRKGKRSPDEAFLRAVRRHWPHLREVCRNAVSVRLGIINGPRFYAALERASFGQAKFLGSLFRTISFELWLQSGAGAKRLSL
jgi:asparagine synthase (glutamine-hydrolysing)